MTDRAQPDPRRTGKYHRARLRNLLFTHGPNRLTGGRMLRRHLASEVMIRELDLTIPNWPKAFDGIRIGHVSDFHLGPLLPIDRALALVERMADMGLDMVACTGDVVDLHHIDAPPLLNALGRIDSPLGNMIVLGNHDELDDHDAMVRHARDAGLRLFQNDAFEIVRNDERLVVGGIEWARTAQRCAAAVDRACRHQVHLLLAHNPKAFDRAAERGVPLTLAGHTHGGQVALPRRRDTNLAIAHRRSAGLYSKLESQLYVTTGVGSWFPLRVNVPPEIAVLTVRSASP